MRHGDQSNGFGRGSRGYRFKATIKPKTYKDTTCRITSSHGDFTLTRNNALLCIIHCILYCVHTCLLYALCIGHSIGILCPFRLLYLTNGLESRFVKDGSPPGLDADTLPWLHEQKKLVHAQYS